MTETDHNQDNDLYKRNFFTEISLDKQDEDNAIVTEDVQAEETFKVLGSDQPRKIPLALHEAQTTNERDTVLDANVMLPVFDGASAPSLETF